MSLRQSPIGPIFVLTAVFVVQWLLLFAVNGPTWDAVSYYIYARSAVFDGDLHFGNDYLLSYPTSGEQFAAKEFDQVTTSTGRVENIFAAGAPLLWLPWLALLRLGALTGMVPGVNGQTMTGYEPYFVGNIAFLSALIGLLAFILSYLVAETAVGKRIALAATITLMFATPLLYYQFREPMYSHTASALAIALSIFIWWRQVRAEQFGAWQGLGLGATIGFAGLVRYQNLIYLAVPAITMSYDWIRSTPEHRKNAWRGALVYLLAVGIGTLAVFAIQMSIWRVIYGTFFTIPYVQGTDLVNWRAPFLDELLFSSFRGLLPWMPVFFLSLVGLLALGRREPRLAWPLLVVLLLAVYINGTTRDWFGGGGYGPRRLTSELVLLIIGYAAFLQLIPGRIRAASSILLGFILAVHQWLLLRYGLAELIGGRVISMIPTYKWEDEPLPLFLSELLYLLPQTLRDPLDFLVFAGSPLDLLIRQRVWPGTHSAVLLQTALFFAILLLGGAIVANKSKRETIVFALVGIALLLLIATQFWILNWA